MVRETACIFPAFLSAVRGARFVSVCVREGVRQNIVVEDQRCSLYTRIYIFICIYMYIHNLSHIPLDT